MSARDSWIGHDVENVVETEFWIFEKNLKMIIFWKAVPGDRTSIQIFFCCQTKFLNMRKFIIFRVEFYLHRNFRIGAHTNKKFTFLTPKFDNDCIFLSEIFENYRDCKMWHFEKVGNHFQIFLHIMVYMVWQPYGTWYRNFCAIWMLNHVCQYVRKKI